jgi:hypothetical protein
VALSGFAFVTGCENDSERADRDVQRNINDAAAERGDAAIQKGLQKAAKTANASPGVAANAKVMLAQAQVDQARQVLRSAAQDDLVIERLAAEISDLAHQVNTNNTVVAGYQELSPKATSALDKELKAAQAQVKGGGADAKWTPQGAGPVPALSSAAARIQKLQADIKGLEGKRADLVKQRAAADAKAADLQKQSRAKEGKESVNLFTQSVAAGKNAADIGNQVGQLDHQLMALKQDLAMAQAQQAELDATVKNIAQQIAANEKAQQETQQLIEAQKALSSSIVNGEGGAGGGGADKGDTATPPAEKSGETGGSANPAAFQEKAAAEPAATPDAGAAAAPAASAPAESAPAEGAAAAAPAEGAAPATADQGAAPTRTDAAAIEARAKNAPPSPIVTNASMAAKAKEMSTLVAHATAQRKAAADLLTQALANFDSAIADATKLQTAVQKDSRDAGSKAPQKAALDALKDLYSPAKLNLQKAAVQQMLADVYRDDVRSLVTRQQMLASVKPVLEEAGIAMPAGLDDGKVDAQLQEAQGAANAAYEEARKLIQEEVIEKAPSDQALLKSANVMLVVNQYGRAQLAAATNDSSADALLNAARQTVSTTPDDFPIALRASLGIQAPTTAPSATQPAEGTPTTAPAGAATEPTAAPAAPAGTTTEPAPAPAPAAPGSETPPAAAPPAATAPAGTQ